MTQKAFGLDIGFSSIKVIKLVQKGQLAQLKGFNKIPLEKNSFIEKELVNKQYLAEIIQRAIAKAYPKPIKERNVIAGLPESLTFNKLIRLPKMPPKEAEKAISWQASQFIPLPKNEIYLDWQVLPSEKEDPQMSVFIVACPKRLADSYLEVINLAGLELVALEIEPVANVRALHQELQNKPTLIVDIGAQTTGLIIYDQEVIGLTASLLSGSETITKLLSQKLNLSLKEAENIKKSPPKDQKKAIQLVSQEVLANIANEALKSINFYQKEQKTKISQILLCGEGANLAGIKSYFSKTLKITTKLANPLVNFTPASQIIPKKEVLNYTTAIGLALKEVK